MFQQRWFWVHFPYWPARSNIVPQSPWNSACVLAYGNFSCGNWISAAILIGGSSSESFLYLFQKISSCAFNIPWWNTLYFFKRLNITIASVIYDYIPYYIFIYITNIHFPHQLYIYSFSYYRFIIFISIQKLTICLSILLFYLYVYLFIYLLFYWISHTQTITPNSFRLANTIELKFLY